MPPRIDLSLSDLLVGMMVFYKGPPFSKNALRRFLETQGFRLTPRRTETGDRIDPLNDTLFHLIGTLLVPSPFGEHAAYRVIKEGCAARLQSLHENDLSAQCENYFQDLAFRFARSLDPPRPN